MSTKYLQPLLLCEDQDDRCEVWYKGTQEEVSNEVGPSSDTERKFLMSEKSESRGYLSSLPCSLESKRGVWQRGWPTIGENPGEPISTSLLGKVIRDTNISWQNADTGQLQRSLNIQV